MLFTFGSIGTARQALILVMRKYIVSGPRLSPEALKMLELYRKMNRELSEARVRHDEPQIKLLQFGRRAIALDFAQQVSAELESP
jgi:uncharacterized protein YneF (UPF0154 family)